MSTEIITDAIPVTLESARIIYALLKGSFENSGYAVYMGGSTPVYGVGRDLDILLLRQNENAIKPTSVLTRLRQLGFLDEIVHTGEFECGFVGLLHGNVIDITIVGWDEEDQP